VPTTAWPSSAAAVARCPSNRSGRTSWRLFSWQNFWRNATVAVSLLFGKYCPIIV
jgi:hypothetical protein